MQFARVKLEDHEEVIKSADLRAANIELDFTVLSDQGLRKLVQVKNGELGRILVTQHVYFTNATLFL